MLWEGFEAGLISDMVQLGTTGDSDEKVQGGELRWGWNNFHSSREEQAEQTVTRSGLNVLLCGSDFTSVNSTRKHMFLCKG